MSRAMSFDRNEIRSGLLTLPCEKRLAFGLSCAERLYPNYLAFSAQERWGAPGTLRAALDLVWSLLQGQESPLATIKALRQGVMDAAPDTEDFGSVLGSKGLDAAAACVSLLDAIVAQDVAPIVDIASLCYDTVEMFVQATEYPSESRPQAEVDMHPLIQAELRRQHDDLRMLAELPWTPAEIVKLRDMWRQPSTSNIGLPNPEHAR